MHLFRLSTVTAGILALVLLGSASPAGAILAITAPLKADLGSASLDSHSISAPLGTVTVAGSAAGTAFKVMVSATAFTTETAAAGTAGGGDDGDEAGNQTGTISAASILYFSGPATASRGAAVTAGQGTAADAVNLSQPRTAFAGTARGTTTSVSWNPTIVINIPATAVAGSYTGVITHSVA